MLRRRLHAPTAESPPDAETRRWRLSVTVLTAWVLAGFVSLLPALRPLFHWQYSDLTLLYTARHLATHALPYLQQPIEYPVLLGWWLWLTAWAPGGETGYVIANALGLWGSAIAILWLLSKVVPRHYHWFAWSPLLLPYASLNWDLLGIAALSAAWYAWQRRRAGWAGFWLAIGVAIKFFPVIAWPFMAYGSWQRGDRVLAVRMTIVMGAVWTLVNLPMMARAPSNWAWFFRFNAERPVGSDLWWLLRLAPGLSIRQVDAFSLMVVLLAATLALAAMRFGLRAREATALVFVVFLAVNKVFSPQYMLWAYTVAILAEWPVWTLAVLTVGGLVDAVNTFGAFLTAFDRTHGHRGQGAWWAAFYPWGIGVRYGALLLSAAGSHECPASHEAIHVTPP